MKKEKLFGKLALLALWVVVLTGMKAMVVKADTQTYMVIYDGNGATSGNMKSQIMEYDREFRLQQIGYKRKGYKFTGWCVDEKGIGDSYANAQKVMNIASEESAEVTLYAQWDICAYKIKYILNGGVNTAKNPTKYTINTSTITLSIPGRSGYGFLGWYSDKNFKHKVEKIKKGTCGDITLYAKWGKSVDASSNSAKITKCKALSKNKVVVDVNIPRLVKSSDKKYYLVRLEPDNKSINSVLAKADKDLKERFTFDIREDAAILYRKIALAVKINGKYKIISNTTEINNPAIVSENTSKYFVPKTKKGIQFTCHDDLKSTGAKNTFLNLPISAVVSGTRDIPFKYNGKTYYFSNLNHYRLTIQDLNSYDVNVTLQIMLDWGNSKCKRLIAKEARVAGKNYYTWNIDDKAARDEMEAIFAYLASIFGKQKCCVSNWVLGNEVNACNVWNYKGNMSAVKFYKSYAYTFAKLYTAVKSNSRNSKVFTCVDHTWSIATDGFGGKEFLKNFSKEVKKINKKINWNLAYHAYPVPLNAVDFWNNAYTTNNENSKYITVQNINVLTKYIKKHYGKNTRIILSEQGFTATKGQKVQAAALALAYYKVAHEPMIDSFIIRCYSDAPSEVAMGLSMGIKGRKAFSVFKYMDTPQGMKYTKQYLKLYKVKSWSKLIKGFNKKYLTKMYRNE